MKLLNSLVTLGTACVALASNVLELTDKNFQSVVVDSKIPTIVDIYASWCGHCKRLNPVYEELADAFSHAKGKIQVVKIDGDIHRKTAKKYGVTGFPTIKFFGADGSVEDVQVGRDLDSLAGYISEKSGVPRKFVNAAQSAVVQINDKNFEEIVGDEKKVAIVAFTASWCGHCKNLKPVYKELAAIYAGDEEVVIGEVDTTEGGATQITERFGVRSYPTILVFPYGKIPESAEEVQQYKEARTLEAFTQTINQLAGTGRAPDGSLTRYAGRYTKLDRLSRDFVKAAGDARALVRESIVKAMVQAKDDGQTVFLEAAKVYLKFAEKIEESEAYLDKEVKRLSNIIARGGLKKSKLDELTKKLNILKTYIPGYVLDADLEKPKKAEKKEEKKDEL